jgi:hypothetical protein
MCRWADWHTTPTRIQHVAGAVELHRGESRGSGQRQVRVSPGGPTDHNLNILPTATPLVSGPTIQLPGHHAKVNRAGYIGRRRGGRTPATTNRDDS